jgi:hypothetical protein
MNSNESSEEIDHILDVLSKPLNRFILSVLAGVDPGPIKGKIESVDEVENQ